MKRASAAVLVAGFLLASLPGAVGAARVTKANEHFVFASCDASFDGGYIATFAESSSAFPPDAGIDIWYDPAIPFEDPSSVTGFTDQVDASEGAADVTYSATWTVTDADGNVLGDASMTMSLVKVGEPVPEQPTPTGNHHSTIVITDQNLEGTATADVLGTPYELTCFGVITDIQGREANPTSFVGNNEGVQIFCNWETDDALAGLFVVSDTNGSFADTYLATGDSQQYNSSSTVAMTATALHATMPMADINTGEPTGTTATADATFEAAGSPVTSFLVQDNVRTKYIQQTLTAAGSLDFSSGESFPIDTEHCEAISFANHTVATSPKGPKAGTPPPNDTPDGAIELSIGSSLNVQTTGTAVDPEVGITTCPEGDRDDLGHTVWYTFEGTGGDVTVDTAGSNFDSVVAIYTRDGDEWTEVGCQDDVTLPSGALSYQANLTISTDEGVTYWVQAGGFRRFFDPDNTQSGRLRLAID